MDDEREKLLSEINDLIDSGSLETSSGRPIFRVIMHALYYLLTRDSK